MAENTDDIPSIPLPPAAGGVPPIEPPPATPPAPPAAPAPPAPPGAPVPLPPVAAPRPDPYAAPGAAPSPYTQPQAGYAAPPPGYAAPPPGYAPGQAYAYAPAAAGPVQGLSIAAMITGIAALFLSFVSLGFLPSIAAVILGHFGQKRQPYARPFWITGLITGYIALGISLIWGLFFFGSIITGIIGSSYY